MNPLSNFCLSIGLNITDLPSFEELTKLTVREETVGTNEAGNPIIHHFVGDKLIAIQRGPLLQIEGNDPRPDCYDFTYLGRMLCEACIDQIIKGRSFGLKLVS